MRRSAPLPPSQRPTPANASTPGRIGPSTSAHKARSSIGSKAPTLSGQEAPSSGAPPLAP
eukprot:4014221-Alexandrium_andersonii.AAC.1